jgi:hypothetical protein
MTAGWRGPNPPLVIPAEAGIQMAIRKTQSGIFLRKAETVAMIVGDGELGRPRSVRWKRKREIGRDEVAGPVRTLAYNLEFGGGKFFYLNRP